MKGYLEDGTLVKLVPYAPRRRDLDVARLLMMPEVWSCGFDACGRRFPTTLQGALSLTYDLYRDGELYSVLINGIWAGTTGIIEIKEYDTGETRVVFGRTLLDPRVWGLGVNKLIKDILLWRVFAHYNNYSGVEAFVAVDNHNSISSLEKIGFTIQREGEGKSWDGKYRYYYMMLLEKQTWIDKHLNECPCFRAGHEYMCEHSEVPLAA